jgi:UDP-glucose 4-epimerase
MRILLVGGNGFIGSHVTDEVLAAGADVTIFDRAPERYRSPLHGVHYVQGDLADQKTLSRVLKGETFDTVMHLAAGSSLPGSSIESTHSDIDNLRDSIMLFHLCATRGVRKVVFISSGGTVYGIPKKLSVLESHPTNPICSYGIVKLAIEKYLLSYSLLYDFDAVVLRLANPYGVRQSPVGQQGAVPIFMWKVLHRQPLTVWGDGSTVRDFVHVTDAARVCALAATCECSGVFNVGSGQGLALRDLVRAISETLNMPANIVYTPRRNFDVARLVLDCTRARDYLNWRPRVPLTTGLNEVAEWLKALARAETVTPPVSLAM